jgi:hypothetical protein
MNFEREKNENEPYISIRPIDQIDILLQVYRIGFVVERRFASFINVLSFHEILNHTRKLDEYIV